MIQQKGAKEESAEGSKSDQSTDQTVREMRVEQSGDQSTENGKTTAKTC